MGLDKKEIGMNILLTSVGRRSYLVEYFKEALAGEGEVHVLNSSNLTPPFEIADKASISPLTYDEEYIPFLLKYCEDNKIAAIISLLDIDLPIQSKNREKFDKIGTRVIAADEDFIEVCNDKWKTYQFLTERGFDAPKTYVKVDDALKAVDGGQVEFPLIVKPRWGLGSIAVYEADNEEELNIFYKKARKNIMKSYLKYESADNVEESVLIQEKLSGQEYGLDVINDLDGNYVVTSVKMKYAMRSGETDSAITVENKKIEEIGQRISRYSKHPANLDVDVFVDGDKIYILEMNARFGGGYPFSHLAGVNLPQAIVKWLKNEEVEKSILTPKPGVMSHKDISIVRMTKNTIQESNNKRLVEQLLSKLEKRLTPSLSERNIDIAGFAEKICENGIALIAYEYDNPIALSCIYANDIESKKAFLTFIAVDELQSGKGIGSKLLKASEQCAKKKGMQYMYLETHNERAKNFYKSNNYIEASENLMYKKL